VVRVVVAGALVGCGGDSASDGDEQSSSTGGGETVTETADTTVGESGTMPGTDTVDSTGTDSVDSTGGAPLEVQAEVITYPEQPMVADLILTPSAEATAVVMHSTDAGVRIAELDDGDPATLAFRVRGLAPATDHVLDYEVTPTTGTAVVDQAPFTTPDALPGFLAAFELETSDTPPEPLYRMFDHAGFPTGPTTGLFVVDEAGITRFYLGGPNDLSGPAMVWAAAKLLDDGTLLYLRNETLYHRTELGETLLELPAMDLGLPSLHHEIMVLPSGNYLALSLAFQDVMYPEPLGLQHVAGDLIVEFTPAGEIVWEWDSFDHLVPLRLRESSDAPPIIDPDTGEDSLDWTHANGLIYEEGTDTVIMSLRHQDWIIRIDRASGDILWRLGPEGDFTLPDGDRWFFHPHSPQWQDDGSLLLYDNGVGNPDPPPEGIRSRAVRFDLDDVAMTASVAWEDDEAQFVAPVAGDADRLPGGHLLVLDSSIVTPEGIYARLRELDETASPNRLWSIVTPLNTFAYRATAHDRLPGMPAN